MRTTSESRPVGYGAWMKWLDERLPNECFRVTDRDLAADLKRMIAEVMQFHPKTEVRIGGVCIPAGAAQEVYRQLEVSHVELVIDNFRAQAHEIQRPKAYLRTALYNAVFELNARTINQVAADMGGTG